MGENKNGQQDILRHFQANQDNNPTSLGWKKEKEQMATKCEERYVEYEAVNQDERDKAET